MCICDGDDIEIRIGMLCICVCFLFQMSLYIKRTLNDLTNENKRLKNDSAIDMGELKNTYSTSTSSGMNEF